MADSEGALVTASVAALLTALLLGCGGDQQAPGSAVESAGTGGMGGASGAGGSLALGNKTGTGGTGGAASGRAPVVTLHVCGMPEQSCATKVHMGDVVVHSNAEALALAGVTSITGNLTIKMSTRAEDGAHVADAFNCLESVTGDLSIDPDTSDGDSSLWGLRNLKVVDGNLTISNVFNRATYPDCGLARLERVGSGLSGSGGSIELGGLGGELDLSLLTSLARLSVENTDLTRIQLPVSGTFQMTELDIENNPFLNEIAGFEGVTVQTRPQPQGDVVRITNNRKLSDCRAKNIGQLFVNGGAEPADIITFGNLECLTE